MSYKNEVGLFLGLLSYPYYLDGKTFYKQKIVKFFEKHREYLNKYDIANLDSNRNDIKLYHPKGYRLFGTQGLAVLSLVDEYSFFTRVFSKNHIQSILKKGTQDGDGYMGDGELNKKFHFKSVVASGVMETIVTDDGDSISLNDIASETFLKEDNKYTYIGIIRLKIDPRVLTHTKSNEGLEDQGIAVTKKIRKAIYNIKNDERLKDEPSKYFCIDCFDNDEMTVVAFANNMLFLYNFLGQIRSLKCSELENQKYRNGDKVLEEKHVFLSSLLCFGYDPEMERAVAEDKKLNGFSINCLIESKAGHRDSLFEYLKQKNDLFDTNIITNITGGCNIIAKVPVAKIESLEELCEKDKIFIYHTRSVKISLPDVYELKDRIKKKAEYEELEDSPNESSVDLNQLREELKSLGVSKAVRDRTMALFELFDNAHRNILQQFYLDELKGALRHFQELVIELRNDSLESLQDIEETLNRAIENMESAIYDRLHRQKYSQAPLEYNGGIQQYLTAFDHAYKTIVQTLGKDEQVYVTVTGADRTSSVRNLFRLNINDIVYPELFAYAVWKEASNYVHEGLKRIELEDDYSSPDFDYQLLQRWYTLLVDKPTDSRILDNIKYRLYHDNHFDPSDPVHKYIYDWVSNEMLSYFFQDTLVFHFTFLKDFKLMWHTYLKAMLQTTICYYRLNKIDKRYLSAILLRLFVVSKMIIENSDSVDNFINEQIHNPFDTSLNEAWVECFPKIKILSDIIWNVIETERFQDICAFQISWNEGRIDKNVKLIYDENAKLEKEIIRRREESEAFRKKMDDGEVIVPEEGEKPVNFLICLLNAYLTAVRDLDCPDGNKQYPIKIVPRIPKDGSILDIGECNLKDELNDKMSNILSDPTGGFFTRSAEIRQKYFMYRTVLYRSLWNFRFTN